MRTSIIQHVYLHLGEATTVHIGEHAVERIGVRGRQHTGNQPNVDILANVQEFQTYCDVSANTRNNNTLLIKYCQLFSIILS